MDLNQWSLALNNSSNIWMAGMMTIQTIVIMGGAWVAYREFISKQNEPKRIAASKLFDFDYFIDSELEALFHGNNLEFNDPDFQELYSNFPKKYLWSIIRIYEMRNKILERQKTSIDNFEKELEIIGDQNLKFLFYDKIDLKIYIEGDIINANSELFELNLIAKEITEATLEAKISQIFQEIPSHSTHSVSQNVRNYWGTKREIQNILRPLLRS
ncbi:hypothetical protein [Algoriphagus aquimarinus]|uniref:DUF4760 domain-containing protein n=1 Tax=Algoriphagus aquimarinus TaxID=237018 RepID=A0A5C7AA27_9BACT|nr:hypothetical protein [Algoriphagus aquimarinus]TXE01837.1 hypothetical protein ESV85_21955 [Algoriphagus aquimarinus]